MAETPQADAIVLFGATGDLSRRMLLPSLYFLDADGFLPEGFRIMATARAELTREAFLDQVHEAARARGPRASTRRSGRGSAERLDYVAADATTRRGRGRAAARTWSGAKRADLLPGGLAQPLRPGLRGAGRRGPGRRRDSRIVLEKPIGRDLETSRADQRRGGRGVRRGADLPHRPLPGQGDGAEPDRAALRQHPLRAAVEQPDHRPRADHRGRDRRAWASAGPTTTSTARCATCCRTTCCSCSAWWPWSRRPTWSRDSVRNEKVKVLRSLRRFTRADAPERLGARPVHAGRRRRQGGRRLRDRARPGHRHRDLRGAARRHRQLALGRRAVLPAHRQAPARAAHPDRHPVQAGAALDLRRRRQGRPDRQPPGHRPAAGRGHRAHC